ncbi:MAG: YHS domain-containing (seleno)protein [Pseudomonadota bacterium]
MSAISSRKSRRQVLLLCGAAALSSAIIASPSESHAGDRAPVYTGTFSNEAISGYDAVAYFTEGRPVEGSGEFQTEWNGAIWKFANADNLATFKADPVQYAPQYGGYCAWAMARGSFASTQPENWSIVDGKLYLNYNDSIQQRWEADTANFIANADAKWDETGF